MMVEDFIVVAAADDARHTPFRDLLRWVYQTLIGATADDVADLRPCKGWATRAA